jgi:replicative DNA helicase
MPVSIDELNKMTNGGIEQKTLNCVVSSTGGGKSVWLCQEAAYHLMQGKNVLYITLEMSEVQISKRIDANILDIKQDNFKTMSDEAIKLRINQVRQKVLGKLIVKEFPADSITALDIKKIIEQLRRKRKIEIDLLVVDYLGLMGSYRYSTKNNNSYSIGKHSAEELRSLAVQYNIPIWTAIQFNRGAENPEDMKAMGLSNVSDSYGIPMGMDFMFAILHTDEMDKQGKSIFKILKNRYGESKNMAGLFSVITDWGCAKFRDDPNCKEIALKDDSKTKEGAMVDKKVREKEKAKADNNNTIGNSDGDIWDN